MVRQNRPADNMGSVASEHPDPRKMGAVWFRKLFVQNLRYSSEAASALHLGWDGKKLRHAHLLFTSRKLTMESLAVAN